MTWRAFKGKLPTLTEYLQTQGLHPDTVRRAARALLWPVARLLRARRPGPKRSGGRHAAPEPDRLPASWLALQACNALLRTLLPASLSRLLDSPQRRGLVVEQVRHFAGRGVSLKELAGFLGLCIRTLERWLVRSHQEGSRQEVPYHSRRPHSSPTALPPEIQETLRGLRASFPDSPVAELSRIFHLRYPDLLQAHGLRSISSRTVRRYVKPTPRSSAPAPAHSLRGAYRYPPPMTLAWTDTAHLRVLGVRVYLVGALEACGRVALTLETFAQENASAVAQVLSQALSRVPGLRAIVRDRGKPFLNRQIDDLLARAQVIPINAYPYFPIDKAALERFWGTLKDWLRSALRPFIDRCRQEDRVPSAEEIVRVLQPALRVFLRAYNLLPQPYLEGQCPLARLEAALRDAGATPSGLVDLRRLATEREDRDALLNEVRDGLQIHVPLDTVRHDFSGISAPALREALDVCHPRLILARDPTIHSPYDYLHAVARRKERFLQDQAFRNQRRADDESRRHEDERRSRGEQEQERRGRETSPENYLPQDLANWLRSHGHPISRVPLLFARILWGTLQSLKTNLGEAFPTHLSERAACIPSLLLHLAPGLLPRASDLQAKFLALASTPLCPGFPLPVSSPARAQALVRHPPGDASCSPIGTLVRQVLDRSVGLHVCPTNVPP